MTVIIDGSASADFATPLPVAEGGTGATASTGSGNVVLSASPTLTGTIGAAALTLTTPLPVASGGTGATSNAGKVLQVVQGTKTDTFSTSSGAETAFVDTGLSVTITPSSSSNKILVLWNMNVGASAANITNIKLQRGTTDISVGDASGNRIRVTQASGGNWATYASDVAAGQYLDSPSTTSATTYRFVWASNGSATAYMNRSGRDHVGTNDEDPRGVSTITVMEVGG